MVWDNFLNGFYLFWIVFRDFILHGVIYIWHALTSHVLTMEYGVQSIVFQSTPYSSTLLLGINNSPLTNSTDTNQIDTDNLQTI